MEVFHLTSVLISNLWVYRFPILLIVIGGLVFLYFGYKGRGGSYSKWIPTRDPRYLGFAFGMELRNDLMKLPLLQRTLILTSIIGLGILLGAIAAPPNFILHKTNAVDLQSNGTLTYYRMETAIDPLRRNLGVDILYEATPSCDSTTTDVFTVTTGDDASYSADCKGVVNHMYSKLGIYTSQYLRNGVVIADVVVDVSKPLQ